jgi:toxin YoeB
MEPSKIFGSGRLGRKHSVQSKPEVSLVGDLKGAFSRRLNIQHRLVYQVLDDEKVVKVLRLWSHYD